MYIKVLDWNEEYKWYQAYIDVDDHNGRAWFTVSASSKKSKADAIEKVKRAYHIELAKRQSERRNYKPAETVIWNP